MKRKRLLFLCLIVLAGVYLAGCDNEQNRTVVTVASINNNAPFFSDVATVDTTSVTGTTVQEDYVSVVFNNQPYSNLVVTGPNAPYSNFMVTSYTIVWSRTDGGTGVPPNFTGATSIQVPSGDLIEGAILLVPYSVKNSPLMTDIKQGGPNFPDQYVMIATITFTGHEVGTNSRDQDFTASLTVTFGDYVDQ